MSSSKIHELEQQIEAEKQKERFNRYQEELERKKSLIGITMATHSLNTYLNSNKQAFEFQLFHVKDVYKEPDQFTSSFVIDLIHIIKDGDQWNIKRDISSCYGEIPYWLGSFRYEIDPNTMELFNQKFFPVLETALDELRADFKMGLKVSNGQHTDANTASELLVNQGFHLYDLSEQKYNLVLQTLKWKHHPFLYNSRLLLTPDSLLIVLKIAEEMERSARSWGGKVAERDLPRAEALKKFYHQAKTKLQ